RQIRIPALRSLSPTIIRRMLNMRGSQVSRRVAKSDTDYPPQRPAISVVACHQGKFVGNDRATITLLWSLTSQLLTCGTSASRRSPQRPRPAETLAGFKPLIAVALGAALVAGPTLGAAQQPGKMSRIGILSPAARPDTKIFDAFRKGLGDLGDIDGQNITIEYRLAAGDFKRLPTMAADLVQMPVDLIVTDGGDKVAKIARDATWTIPIVGGLGADPVAADLVRSFAHPGGNV